MNLTNIIEREDESTYKSDILALIKSNKFEESIEKDYYGKKGIIKRTIGIGKVNVKVYEEEEEEDDPKNKEFKINNNNNNENKINEIIDKKEQENKEQNNNNILFKSSELVESKTFEHNGKEENQNPSSCNSVLIEEIKIENNNKISESINKNKKKKKKSIKYYNNNKNNSINFNIDGKKFIIKVKWCLSYNEKSEENINVKLSTIYPGSQIIHWGIFTSNSPKTWSIPPKEYYPKFTNENINKALETKFENFKDKQERIISIILPKQLNKNENVEVIYFVVYDPIKNLWYNNFKRNFTILFNFK